MPKENLNQSLDHFADQSIKIMSEALAEKDETINFWRNQAKALSIKYKACLYCQSDQDFIPELLECKACQQREAKLWKSISLKSDKEVAHE